ncbi:homeobox protein cut-like 1 [Artibeus jamaicensis]|uniref:homeobox protein cut-like 1 n=1 Tax=Artibeus jamaicensis TaxID=9417 RepID=UPI00235AA0A0|nr:homeobox protein cut-like 1 [Artibeus jamaicensis]
MLEADSCHRLRPTEEPRGEGVEGRPVRQSRWLGIPTRGRSTLCTVGVQRPPARGRPSPRRRPGCVTRWRPRGPGRVPGVRGGGGKRPRGERLALGAAFPAPRCDVRSRRSGWRAGLEAGNGSRSGAKREGGRRRRAVSATLLRAGGYYLKLNTEENAFICFF